MKGLVCRDTVARTHFLSLLLHDFLLKIRTPKKKILVTNCMRRMEGNSTLRHEFLVQDIIFIKISSENHQTFLTVHLATKLKAKIEISSSSRALTSTISSFKF